MNGRFFKGQKYHGKDRALYFKQWSCEFTKCIKCGTNAKTGKHKHKGKGLCHSCWDKQRAKNPKRKQQLKNQSKKWWNKVKGTEAHRIYSNLMVKRWQQKINPCAHKANWKRRNLKLKFKKFIQGKLKIDKRFKNGLKFYCDGCPRRCLYQSCVKPPKCVDSENDRSVRDLEIFKKVLIKNCKNKF